MSHFDWNAHQAEQERRERRRAAVFSTVTYAVIVVACLFLVAFQEVTPPPGEQFVAVGVADFGNVEEAGGERETETPSERVEEVIEQEVSESTVEEVAPVEAVVTEEASEVDVPTQEEVVEEVTEVEDPDPEPEISQDLSNALSQMFSNSGGGGSEGQQQGVGNSGAEDGKIEGAGVVSGDFGDSFLEGGTMIGEPSLDRKPDEEGVIRMKIYVDKSGKVTDARFDPSKSTTSSSRLVALAKEAALTARFSSHPTKPTRIGWIQFNFELQ